MEQYLESQFRMFQRRRDATGRDIETRLGNVRFLGELTKFRLVPFGALLSRLKVHFQTFMELSIHSLMQQRWQAALWTVWCWLCGGYPDC